MSGKIGAVDVEVESGKDGIKAKAKLKGLSVDTREGFGAEIGTGAHVKKGQTEFKIEAKAAVTTGDGTTHPTDLSI